MTVERSWLLPNVDEDDAKPEGAMWYEGWLVPDPRLQAIEDADLASVAALVSELRDLIESEPVAFNSFQWASRFRSRVLALDGLTEEADDG